jgi:hypothetical protein
MVVTQRRTRYCTGYENDNTVLDIYSENPNGTDPYSYNYPSTQCGSYNGEGDCYNREHIVPQSLFNSNLRWFQIFISSDLLTEK